MIEQPATRTESSKAASATTKSEKASLDEILRPLSEEEETLVTMINSLYSQLRSLSYDELLGVDKSADSETIKKNYYHLAKKYHPDRHFTSADPDTKTKLTTIFDALTKAYETLKDDTLRQKYYQSLAAPKHSKGIEDSSDAEEQFKRGVTEYKKKNYWDAIEKFNEAIKLKPDIPQYLSYLSLAYSKVPAKLKEAEEILLQAIKLEPFNADLYTNLGLIYIKGGLKKKAITSFQKALKIDPGHHKAKKGLEQTK